MTANRRIFLNVIASYGRSLLSIACGLFTTRWVLMALGQTDMGLYGLVGGLALFVTFFNIQFSVAISRYFAHSIGQASVSDNKDKALEECRHWFNVSVFIHAVLPLLLVAIGYPLGSYAITHEWLVIPPDRVEACVWVWRFTCISCLVGMLTVPFYGMFTAKQYIAEVTVYNVAQTIAKTAFIYFMVTHPGYWLTKYALGLMLISVIPALLISIRAIKIFPECRFRLSYMWDMSRFKQVLSYVSWQVIGSGGYVLRHTGVSVLVNKMLGPKANTALTIGNTVSVETSVLTTALNGAFAPAIATACGAGDLNKMRQLAFSSCKFGVALTALFALPLLLEVDEVLKLWLKNPPEFAVEMCIALILSLMIERSIAGHVLAVNSIGKLARFQTIHGISLMLALPVVGVSYWMFPDIWSVGAALIGTMGFTVFVSLLAAKEATNMSIKVWLTSVMMPNLILCIVSLAVGILPRFFMEQSFIRVVVTTFFTLIAFLPMAWFFVLSKSEREFLTKKLKAKFHR